MRFDESFYTQAGVDFAKRWDSFYYPKDIKSEISLFEELHCKKMGYAFLHEDKSRKYLVNREKISKGLKVIEPGTHQSQRNFFDYGYILENAAELHCIESSFTALIESMQILNIKYAHRYSRPEAKGEYCFEFTHFHTFFFIGRSIDNLCKKLNIKMVYSTKIIFKKDEFTSVKIFKKL